MDPPHAQIEAWPGWKLGVLIALRQREIFPQRIFIMVSLHCGRG